MVASSSRLSAAPTGGRPLSHHPRPSSLRPALQEELESESVLLGSNASEYVPITFMKRVLAHGLGMEPRDTDYFMARFADAKKYNARESLVLLPKHRSFLENIAVEIEEVLEENRRRCGIIRLQALVRGFLVRNKLFGMSKSHLKSIRMRNDAYRDLLNTERKYIGNLGTLINMFMKPLRTQQIAAPFEIANIFMNIETVYDCHITLLGRLENAGENWPFVKGVGSIFMTINALLKAYDTYVSNFKNAINEVQRLKGTNAKFDAFLMEHEGDEDLQTLLSLPVNRISQYEYLIQALNDHEPEGSSENEDLLNAFAILQQSSKVVQRSLTESTETAKLIAIQRQLKADGPLSLAQPGRKFVRDAFAKKATAFLCNDLLILCKPSGDKKFAAKMGTTVHKVKRMVDICNVDMVPGNDHIEFKFKDGESFKLTFDSKEELEVWVKDIRHLMEEKQRSKMFGTSLAETVIREERSNGVPFMLEKMAEHIQSLPWVLEEGLFRVPGKTSEREHLIEVCNKGGDAAKNIDLSVMNIMTVCDVFKLYFRTLPEPLLSFDLYPHMVEVGRSTVSDDEKLAKIKDLLHAWVPPFAMKVLKFLLSFLVLIASYASKNKMSASNLAIIFGPGLMWTESNSLESAVDMPYVNSVAQILIERKDELFS
eukprot:TRINITY_DN12694_c0_g1_i1.p1 TRINITY_DN12694_c0_g1~~TRINITY_DN12694_c0_g1_i1.p1  ORF type:complete len:671 (-),score=230.46 TRINITY_DN12694_c0_g1_i1:84-2048(-)